MVPTAGVSLVKSATRQPCATAEQAAVQLSWSVSAPSHAEGASALVTWPGEQAFHYQPTCPLLPHYLTDALVGWYIHQTVTKTSYEGMNPTCRLCGDLQSPSPRTDVLIRTVASVGNAFKRGDRGSLGETVGGRGIIPRDNMYLAGMSLPLAT